jgi:A/G-specific adenine glycosylase
MRLGLKQKSDLRCALLAWYTKNRRNLPWRGTRDPYCIWISEIMLQQTRVAVALDRYQRFLRRFPSVKELARARQSSVVAEWSGLGYYRRARNLHAAARMIVREHAGKFPPSQGGLRTLPGIGRYTAAAIGSIAFADPVAVVDGNVERVLNRLHGSELRGEQVWRAAQELLEQHAPGDFNQAMMELGATVCLPGKPRCDQCPLRKFCWTRGRGTTVTNRARQKKCDIAFALARRADAVLLIQRSAKESVMPEMWELPMCVDAGPVLFSLAHSIMRTNYRVRVVGWSAKAAAGAKWINIGRLNAIPMTGLARKILRHAEII